MMNLHNKDEKCRKCKHTIENHCYFNNVIKCGYRIFDINVLDYCACNDRDYIEGTYPPAFKECTCLMFEPEDNLEYLEMKFKEKKV